MRSNFIYSLPFTLFLLTGPACAQRSTDKIGYAYAFGAGLFPCSAWTDARELEVDSGILGYWSGANALTKSLGLTAMTGHIEGARAAIDDVRTLCAENPNSVISLETSAAYVNARDENQQLNTDRSNDIYEFKYP